MNTNEQPHKVRCKQVICNRHCSTAQQLLNKEGNRFQQRETESSSCRTWSQQQANTIKIPCSNYKKVTFKRTYSALAGLGCVWRVSCKRKPEKLRNLLNFQRNFDVLSARLEFGGGNRPTASQRGRNRAIETGQKNSD